MQNLTNQMDTALAASTTYLCRIWKLTLANGQEFFFTDLTRDITVGGQVYKYDPGISVSAVVKSSGGQPDNAQISLTTSAEFMTTNRLRQGSIKNATFDMWIVDWRDPDFYGLIDLFGGGVAEQKYNNKGQIDLGLNSNIGGGTQSLIGEVYSKQCRALLGDSRCKFDLEGAKVAIEVESIADNGYSFVSSNLIGTEDDYFKFGKVLWDTGLNSGLNDEVKANVNASGKVTLVLYPRNPLVIGDTGFIYPGCDYQVSTCGAKFNNLLNFRGEPYVPPPNVFIFSGLSPTAGSATGNYMNYAPAG